MPKALVVYNNGSPPAFVPHGAGVRIWKLMNGEAEPTEAEQGKLARIKIVYLNHKLAPESYRIARGIDPDPGPQQQEMWYQK